MLNFAVWSISSAKGGTFCLLNPVASIVTVYVPIGKKRIVYTPSAFVLAEVFTAVAMFSAVTFAPATRAPLWSATSPVIEPVTVCANADDRQNRVAQTYPGRQRKKVFIRGRSWCGPGPIA